MDRPLLAAIVVAALAVALLLLIAVKWTIWSVSLGSGTSGGVLAPLLMMGAALGGVEVGLPLRTDAVGVREVLLVEVLDVTGVAAGKLGALAPMLDQTVHDPGPSRGMRG